MTDLREGMSLSAPTGTDEEMMLMALSADLFPDCFHQVHDKGAASFVDRERIEDLRRTTRWRVEKMRHVSPVGADQPCLA